MNRCSFLDFFLLMRPHLLIIVILALALFSATFSFAQPGGFDDPGARSVAGGSGGLQAVEPSVDGGVIPIGATGQVVVLFRNDGSQPVETGLIRLYPSSTVSATVALNQCQEAPLDAGAECAIALSVKGLQAGSWRLEMLMSHSGRSRLVTATITGNVEASAEGSKSLSSDIETIPAEVDFSTLNAAQTLVEPVVLRNITSKTLEIDDIYIDASPQAGYALKTKCDTLEAGQACIATVAWSPRVKGRSSGVLVIKHSGPAALASVPLKGEYLPGDVEQAEVFPEAVPGKGLLVSSQTEVNFGAGVDATSTITVSLVNAGDAPLELQAIRLAGSDNGLSLKGEGCENGRILEPIEACPLTLSWSPTRVGELYDDIQILHDGARGILILPIRGDAEASVSVDQKAIVLGGVIDTGMRRSSGGGGEGFYDGGGAPVAAGNSATAVSNPASVLDGIKITSFSRNRAIIAGPGGSRIIFDREEALLGGIPWRTKFQRNGIEFRYEDQRVLLLFDRSLSSINRTSAQSENRDSFSSSSDNDDN